MRSLRPLVAVSVVASAMATGLSATQWAPREDVGVAALASATGTVLWEAWEERDLPLGSSGAVREAFRELLQKHETWPDPDASFVAFPLELSADRVVTYDYDFQTNEHRLTLHAGTAARPGDALTRFSHANVSALYAQGGGTLYVLVDGYLSAFTSRSKSDDGAWRPDWSFDLAAAPGERDAIFKLQPWSIRADATGLWISDQLRVRRIGSDGKLEFLHDIRSPYQPVKNGFSAPLTIAPSRVYYRHASGVLAIDRASRRELWRFPTHRSPYPSHVKEVEDLVLIQVGSDCPRTIGGALTEAVHPFPQLGRNTARRRIAAATLLKSYGDGYPRAALRRFIASARADAPDETRQAAAAIERLLESWPAARDRQRLIDASVDALLSVSKRNAFGSPVTERVLTWCLLQELLYVKTPDAYGRPGINYAFDSWAENELPLTETRRVTLVRHCRRVLADGPEEEKGFAASVLLSEAVGWSELSDGDLASLFLSPHESVWRWAGMSLAKHGRRDELVALALRRPENEHLSVIYMLANVLPPRLSSSEQEFWLACAWRTPASIAYVLNLTGPKEIPIAYREPIRRYLEANRPAAAAGGAAANPVTTQREYDLNAALRVLHRFRRPEDTPLISAYLKDPHPFVREHVKVLLEERKSN